MISVILNLPYTLLGITVAFLLFPKTVAFASNPYRIVFRTRKNTFGLNFKKGWRGMTVGNVIILNNYEEDKDLEHEIIHVEQFQRLPLIFPIFYFLELLKNGYRNNRFEEEAYSKAKNRYQN